VSYYYILEETLEIKTYNRLEKSGKDIDLTKDFLIGK
tara:strand:+ start:333 stop:443 length:111 start_codon:yes stop_codon:yes gene_type:complete